MSVLPRLKGDETKRRGICIYMPWQECELWSFAGHRQISALTTSEQSCKTLASPVANGKMQKYRYFW